MKVLEVGVNRNRMRVKMEFSKEEVELLKGSTRGADENKVLVENVEDALIKAAKTVT